MKQRPLWLAAMWIFLLGAARAAPPPAVANEIDYLLKQVGSSACAFYRNGSWYDAAHAMAHLRVKFDYLVARNMIATAEDFIDKAASKSSLSGRPYKVKCAGGAEMESSQWLRGVLERYRAANDSQAGGLVIE
jgi:hypothetical protein